MDRLLKLEAAEGQILYAWDILKYLEPLQPNEREHAIGQLVAIANRSQGWAGTVALDALYAYYDSSQHWPSMSREAAELIARKVIKLNDLSTLIPIEALVDGTASVAQVIGPRSCLWSPVGVVELKCGLPRGWRARDTAVEIDGRLALEKHGEYTDAPECPADFVLLTDFISPNGDKESSQHTIVVGVTAVSPNGFEIRLNKTTYLEVAPGTSLLKE
jgi:hypothetical protein